MSGNESSTIRIIARTTPESVSGLSWWSADDFLEVLFSVENVVWMMTFRRQSVREMINCVFSGMLACGVAITTGAFWSGHRVILVVGELFSRKTDF